MRVVLASDKFKGSASAAEVADALAAGITAVYADVELVRLPVADGGDGTVAAAVAAGFSAVPLTVSGPTGTSVATSYARRADVAVVELADACGLRRLPVAVGDPLGASSYGLGQAMAEAIDAGVRQLIVGIGGSASTDGGAGMLQALGATIRDTAGAEIGRGGAALRAVESLDLSRVRDRLAAVRLVFATDVASPLTGADGAAVVYGPQKGATRHDVDLLDRALTRWADVVGAEVGRDWSTHPGAGAAGGVGFAALAALEAELRPGIEVILELLEFADALADADLVVTGEGCLDEQTLTGKAVLGVARAAARATVPVVAVAGVNRLTSEQLAG
ncbi:MAG: glycerate kinase, partial [Actinobacteria bacterium]|nr:glycerate kinase [Actinomycetota bacterium]